MSYQVMLLTEGKTFIQCESPLGMAAVTAIPGGFQL